MSTSVKGRLLDENGASWEGLVVSVHDTSGLFDREIRDSDEPVRSGADGFFRVAYEDVLFPGFGPRTLEIHVRDKVGRHVRPPDKRTDVTDPEIDLGDIEIRRADASGLPVTLLTGTASRLSQGNALTFLVDKEAFEHTVTLFQSAQSSILVAQLYFSVPPQFRADPKEEEPALIFRFGSPDPTAANPRRVGPGDERPERLLLAKASAGVDVKILLHTYYVPGFFRFLIGMLVFPLANVAGVLGVDGLIRDELSGIDEAHGYFDAAHEPRITLHEFRQSVITAGVMHLKLVVVDGTHAVSLGSPFGQSYVGDGVHAIDDPRRGGASGLPKHDVGFEVTGPAVADLHELLQLVWSKAEPAVTIPKPTAAPSPQTQGGDVVSSVQIVRTLTADRFDGLPAGEKGILEGYLRAIAEAEQLIYLENQYFTNDAIGHALVEALTDPARPHLQVIVLLNITPDVWFYPFKQRRLITRIRRAAGRARFGVFTRWTHETGSPRPRMLPIYVHAKVGIVDDKWATVGVANLDGYSLDSSLLSDALHATVGLGEGRAIEVNALIFDGVAGQPANGAADLLRRRLWAEHLNLDPLDRLLDWTKPPAGGWLQLWQDAAVAKRKALVDRPNQSQAGLGHVLPWPEENTTYKTPRKHLDALGVKSYRVVPLKSTRPFVFKDGRFKPDAVAEMDYP